VNSDNTEVVFYNLVEASIADSNTYGEPVKMENVHVCTDKVANPNARGEIEVKSSQDIRGRAARLAMATSA